MKLKKETLWLLLAGTLCMSFPLFSKSFITFSDAVESFLKGFGVSLAIGALLVEKKKQKA